MSDAVTVLKWETTVVVKRLKLLGISISSLPLYLAAVKFPSIKRMFPVPEETEQALRYDGPATKLEHGCNKPPPHSLLSSRFSDPAPFQKTGLDSI